MGSWDRINDAAVWPAAVIASYVDDADDAAIDGFLDGLGAHGLSLPPARLETNFRARTLTVRLETVSDEAVGQWSRVLSESGLVADLRRP